MIFPVGSRFRALALLLLLPAAGAGLLRAQEVNVSPEDEQPAATRVVSLDQYKALLDSWTSFYESEPPEACCGRPDGMEETITVKDQGAEYTVPTGYFKKKFYYSPDDDDDEGVPSKPDPAKVAAAHREWSIKRHKEVLAFLLMLQENASSNTAPFDDSKVSRAEADAQDVLSSHEFRLVKTPSSEKTWWEKLLDWAQQRLSKWAPNMPDIGLISRTLLWVVVGLAVMVAGILVKRWLEREEAEEYNWRLGSARGAISSKHWSVWLQESREAARRGDWRQAVRLGYWSAISSLESSGAWRPDRGRTPREYLRLLAASHAHRGTLSAMTKDFERIWYAQLPATEDDYQQMVQGLERLGCR